MDLSNSPSVDTLRLNYTGQFTRCPDLPKEIRLIIWELALPGSRIIEIRQRALRKTVKEWEREQNTTWRACSGLAEEDNIVHIMTKVVDAYDSGITKELEHFGPNYRWAAIVENRKRRILHSHEHFRTLGRLVGIESTCLPPGVLLACRESHRVAMKYYMKSFSSFGGVAQTWFDFDRDTLFIHTDKFIKRPQTTNLFEVAMHLLAIFPILDIENVRKIKNLAIQWEETIPRGTLEEVLTYILCVFRGVEKLTTVLPHYSDDHRDPKSLIWSEPITFSQARQLYDDLHERSTNPDSSSDESIEYSGPHDIIPRKVHKFIFKRFPDRPVFKE